MRIRIKKKGTSRSLNHLYQRIIRSHKELRSANVSGQVQALAQSYLSLENIAIVVVGEAKQIMPELEKIGPVTVYDTELKEIPADQVPKAEPKADAPKKDTKEAAPKKDAKEAAPKAKAKEEAPKKDTKEEKPKAK